MPASREMALAERLPSRSKIGRAANAAGRRIDHYIVRLARGHEDFVLDPRSPWQNVAIFRNQREAACGLVLVVEPTMVGTCMRDPAFTIRTRTLPGAGCDQSGERLGIMTQTKLSGRTPHH